MAFSCFLQPLLAPLCALQVGDGFEDFSPTPEEARQLISAGYAVPDTLLVQVRGVQWLVEIMNPPPAHAARAGLGQCLSLRTVCEIPDLSRRGGTADARQAGVLWLCLPAGSPYGKPLPFFNAFTVQFTNDDTDETPVAAAMLSSPGSSPALAARCVATAVLPGSHVTPCGASPSWRLAPGAPFGPAEAVAMAAQAALQGDTYRLASRVLAHLDAHS